MKTDAVDSRSWVKTLLSAVVLSLTDDVHDCYFEPGALKESGTLKDAALPGGSDIGSPLGVGKPFGADGWSVLVTHLRGGNKTYHGICRRRASLSVESEQKQSSDFMTYLLTINIISSSSTGQLKSLKGRRIWPAMLKLISPR